MKNLCFSLLMIAGPACFLQAQSLIPDVIASAGDKYTGKNGSLSWTLGETAIETISSETNLLTQGFHQTYLVILKDERPDDPSVDVSVYPNPVNDLLTIEITIPESGPHIRLELFDLLGHRIHDHTIKCQTYYEQLDVSRFSSSLFVLRVTNLKTLQTECFKIHKVNF